MKDEIKLIIGKKIGAVVISERNHNGPRSQVFLVFDDATTYELYGDVRGSGGLDRGGTKWAVNYAAERLWQLQKNEGHAYLLSEN